MADRVALPAGFLVFVDISSFDQKLIFSMSKWNMRRREENNVLVELSRLVVGEELQTSNFVEVDFQKSLGAVGRLANFVSALEIYCCLRIIIEPLNQSCFGNSIAQGAPSRSESNLSTIR